MRAGLRGRTGGGGKRCTPRADHAPTRWLHGRAAGEHPSAHMPLVEEPLAHDDELLANVDAGTSNDGVPSPRLTHSGFSSRFTNR